MPHWKNIDGSQHAAPVGQTRTDFTPQLQLGSRELIAVAGDLANASKRTEAETFQGRIVAGFYGSIPL